MRANTVVTAILIVAMLCAATPNVTAGQRGRSGAPAEVSRPVPQLFGADTLQQYADLELTHPAGEELYCGQWAETDAWAWAIAIAFGAAIAVTLAVT